MRGVGRFIVPCAVGPIVFAACGGLSHDGRGPMGIAGTGGLAGASGASSSTSAGEAGLAGAGGVPACTGGEAPVLCDGYCVDSNQDNANCGTCGHVCAHPSVCMFGICQT
ncbi:MAG TPA: hypothetical protein VMI54_19915 [Polyangiaceae bacterium]|nr:hypothetical protein [Polyangiaceae bacterium]